MHLDCLFCEVFGLRIKNNLKFDEHLNSICFRAFKKRCFLRRKWKGCFSDDKLQAYRSDQSSSTPQSLEIRISLKHSGDEVYSTYCCSVYLIGLWITIISYWYAIADRTGAAPPTPTNPNAKSSLLARTKQIWLIKCNICISCYSQINNTQSLYSSSIIFCQN